MGKKMLTRLLARSWNWLSGMALATGVVEPCVVSSLPGASALPLTLNLLASPFLWLNAEQVIDAAQ